MYRALVFGSAVTLANSQSPGNGISKSTYSCNDPVSAWNFLNKYFPVATPGDECDNNICDCSATSSTPAWKIQQGRVYTTKSSSLALRGRRLQSPGNGFGLHCVNVSNHLTTGGLSTAEVEAHFNDKLGDMTAYDSFMDYSVSFHTSNLAAYATAFDKDSVPYYAATWASVTDNTASTYSSLIVQVPSTQMVLELISSGTLSGVARTVHESTEVRASQRALAMIDELSSQNTGSVLTPVSVNRAASAATIAKLDDFYVTGMGTSKVSDDSDASSNSKRQCYLWPGAEVDICFTNRADSATKGSWKVGDFEDMLNTVHKNIIVGHPYCGLDKWEDNHYAIDSQSASTSGIISYINKNNVPHICQSGSGSGGSGLHYAFDPTGWGIQLDLGFSSSPSDCTSESQAPFKVDGTFNPACEPGTCASSLTV
jgi:hypothetical protein